MSEAAPGSPVWAAMQRVLDANARLWVVGEAVVGGDVPYAKLTVKNAPDEMGTLMLMIEDLHRYLDLIEAHLQPQIDDAKAAIERRRK